MSIPVVDRAPDDAALHRIHVRITNSNDFSITDRFDSVEFVFEPHTPNTIPAEAAHHIFGWRDGASREEMFKHFQKRCGWNTQEYKDKDRKYWEKIDITKVTFRLVEVSEEGDDLNDASQAGSARSSAKK